MTKGRIARLLLVLDYLLNVLMNGWHDEWVSTRAWRMRDQSKFWRFMRRAIDGVALHVFGQQNHCYWSAVSDNLHRAIPPANRT